MGEEQAEVEGREGEKRGERDGRRRGRVTSDGREEKHYLMDGEEGGEEE